MSTDNSTVRKIGNRWYKAIFASDNAARFSSECDQLRRLDKPYKIAAADGKIQVKGQVAVGRVIFA